VSIYSYAKKDVKYTDDHGDSPEQCSKCAWWLGDKTCQVVVGKIKPEGWCMKYVSDSTLIDI
jgi:hypothetical protein